MISRARLFACGLSMTMEERGNTRQFPSDAVPSPQAKNLVL